MHSNLAGPDIRPCERGEIKRKPNPKEARIKEGKKRKEKKNWDKGKTYNKTEK